MGNCLSGIANILYKKKGNYINSSDSSEDGATIVGLTITDEPWSNAFQDRKEYMDAVIAIYCQSLQEKAKHFIGYPINMDFNNGALSALSQLQQFGINNAGDPFTTGCSYGMDSRQFELGVLDWFANLWGIHKDDYWGYVTNGGTEGNLHGILLGREALPDGILYTSKESHYSVFKAARMYRMDCVQIETLVSGEIDCANFKTKLLQNKDKPAIINVNIGTTMKGAIDDLDLVIRTLEECCFPRSRFYIHCDGALFGIMLPFVKEATQVTFKKPIGSISVSGHKFIGCPMPCGIQITRKVHIHALSHNIEYIASRDATISGSRNGLAPVFLWYSLINKGHLGLESDVQTCLDNACYLEGKLKEAGVSAMLNVPSNTVVFERPHDEIFVRRWHLACQGNIAHVIVMPHVTVEMIDTFFDELLMARSNWSNDPPCLATMIGKKNCSCPLHE